MYTGSGVNEKPSSVTITYGCACNVPDATNRLIVRKNVACQILFCMGALVTHYVEDVKKNSCGGAEVHSTRPAKSGTETWNLASAHHPYWFRKNGASVHAVGNVEFLKPPPNVACLRGFVSNSMKVTCNHKFMQLTPIKPVRFIAAMSMNCDGKVMVPAAREMVTRPSSSGWRMVSSTLRLNSGSSSRNKTPLCASEISPGVGLMLPPSRPASLAV